MPTTTTTTTALILLSLIAGAIWATGLAMIHVWVHHRPHRRGAHRPRRGRIAAVAAVSPTVALVELHRAFRQIDPEVTQRLVATGSGPTADLSVPVDPWHGQDADPLLTLIG